MTYDEINSVVQRITYKPDWLLRLGRHDDHSATLLVTYSAEDVNGVGRTVIGHWHTLLVEQFRSDAEVVEYVKGAIHRAEHHEMDEWLKLDGVQLEDPHPYAS